MFVIRPGVDDQDNVWFHAMFTVWLYHGVDRVGRGVWFDFDLVGGCVTGAQCTAVQAVAVCEHSYASTTDCKLESLGQTGHVRICTYVWYRRLY